MKDPFAQDNEFEPFIKDAQEEPTRGTHRRKESSPHNQVRTWQTSRLQPVWHLAFCFHCLLFLYTFPSKESKKLLESNILPSPLFYSVWWKLHLCIFLRFFCTTPPIQNIRWPWTCRSGWWMEWRRIKTKITKDPYSMYQKLLHLPPCKRLLEPCHAPQRRTQCWLLPGWLQWPTGRLHHWNWRRRWNLDESKWWPWIHYGSHGLGSLHLQCGDHHIPGWNGRNSRQPRANLRDADRAVTGITRQDAIHGSGDCAGVGPTCRRISDDASPDSTQYVLSVPELQTAVLSPLPHMQPLREPNGSSLPVSRLVRFYLF